jgi:hypothetical protein
MAAVEHAPGKSIVGAETVSGQRNIRLLLADVDGCACRKLNPGILVIVRPGSGDKECARRDRRRAAKGSAAMSVDRECPLIEAFG